MVANKLRELMKRDGITTEFLAVKCGVSNNTVLNWANQTTQPTAKQLIIIFKLFGLTKLSEFIS